MRNDLAVEVRNLNFAYPDGTLALSDVNLQVRAGEVFTVMGANGAGKTTLCLILTRIIPTLMEGKMEGNVSIFGKEVAQIPREILSQTVSIVLQDPESQLLTPAVEMECAFGPANLGVAADEIRSRVKRTLDVVRLAGMERRAPKDLSGGQKQRLAIAATLTMMPRIVVLDEPTSQLDPIGTEEVLSLVRDLKQLGITIIITEHKSEEIIPISDRVCVLRHGKIERVGTPHEIFADISLMKECGVKIPQTAEAVNRLKGGRVLGNNAVPLTVDEAIPFLRSKYEPSGIAMRSLGASSHETLLEISGIRFLYPSAPPVEALRGVSLTVNRQEFVAIVGQNGSGKSTLAKIMIGLLRPSEGAILFRGKDIQGFTRKDLASRIGMIFQNPDHQIFTQSVEKEVEFGVRNIGLAEEEIKRRTNEVLELTALTHLREKFPFSLSIGDRRKLTVAVVVAMRPEVIILDEPTTGQDYHGRRAIMDLCRDLNGKGRTVILITHDMELVAEYAGRVVVMSEGSVMIDGPTRDIMYRFEEMKKAFLKPPQIVQLSEALSPGTAAGPLTVDEFLGMAR